jgi:hypothetical protein
MLSPASGKTLKKRPNLPIVHCINTSMSSGNADCRKPFWKPLVVSSANQSYRLAEKNIQKRRISLGIMLPYHNIPPLVIFFFPKPLQSSCSTETTFLTTESVFVLCRHERAVSQPQGTHSLSLPMAESMSFTSLLPCSYGSGSM